MKRTHVAISFHAILYYYYYYQNSSPAPSPEAGSHPHPPRWAMRTSISSAASMSLSPETTSAGRAPPGRKKYRVLRMLNFYYKYAKIMLRLCTNLLHTMIVTSSHPSQVSPNGNYAPRRENPPARRGGVLYPRARRPGVRPGGHGARQGGRHRGGRRTEAAHSRHRLPPRDIR